MARRSMLVLWTSEEFYRRLVRAVAGTEMPVSFGDFANFRGFVDLIALQFFAGFRMFGVSSR